MLPFTHNWRDENRFIPGENMRNRKWGAMGYFEKMGNYQVANDVHYHSNGRETGAR